MNRLYGRFFMMLCFATDNPYTFVTVPFLAEWDSRIQMAPYVASSIPAHLAISRNWEIKGGNAYQFREIGPD